MKSSRSLPYLGEDAKLKGLENASVWAFTINTQSDKIRKVIERPAYTMFEFTADLGGHCGGMLGVSVMSLFEFLAYFVVCIASYFK